MLTAARQLQCAYSLYFSLVGLLCIANDAFWKQTLRAYMLMWQDFRDSKILGSLVLIVSCLMFGVVKTKNGKWDEKWRQIWIPWRQCAISSNWQRGATSCFIFFSLPTLPWCQGQLEVCIRTWKKCEKMDTRRGEWPVTKRHFAWGNPSTLLSGTEGGKAWVLPS